MEDVFTFEKSFEERLEEYQDILGTDGVISYPTILQKWSTELTITLKPSEWQAIWKIPRPKCESYKIPFPSIALVVVSNVQYDELTAIVKVLRVEYENNLISKHNYVPLWQLWPLKDQKLEDFELSAESLDKYRFFCLHLTRPWDKDDPIVDWVNHHLEDRLRLYFGLRNGEIPNPLNKHIRSLLDDARRLDGRKECLEQEITPVNDHLEHSYINGENLEELVSTVIQLSKLKTDLEIFENPLCKKYFIKKKKLKIEQKNSQKRIWLIFETALPVKDSIENLQKVKEWYPNDPVSFSYNFALQLEAAGLNDVFILSESVHHLKESSTFIENWNIRGITNQNKIVITSECESVLLDFVSETATFENLTIFSKAAQCAFLMQSGIVTLKNCKITGNKCSKQQGIVLLEGSEVILDNCEITGLSVGIVGNTGSKMTIVDCTIKDMCDVGVALYYNCDVVIKNTTIQYCGQYGLVSELKEVDDYKKICSFENLKECANIEVSSLSGGNNRRGDVLLKRKSEEKAVKYLFNADVSSEDEMDT